MPLLSSSSRGNLRAWALLAGTATPGPSIVASFRIGDNSGGPAGTFEYGLSAGADVDPSHCVHGHLTWDPAYGGAGTPFTSYSQVCLQLTSSEVKWAVGTNDFLVCPCKPFKRIDKVEIVATAKKLAANALVQWDRIDMTVWRRDGSHESVSSPCLPRVSTSRRARRSASSAEHRAPLLQQYAQLCLDEAEFSGVQIRGQVRLAADPDVWPAVLAPEDLAGSILVFTDADSTDPR